MVCSTALSKVRAVRCVTTASKEKPFAWISPLHFPAERKSSGLIFPLENACSLFLRLRKHHSSDYKVNGTKSNTDIYMKTLKRMKQPISCVRRGGREMLFQPKNAWLHTSAVTAAAIQNNGFEVVPHRPYSPVLARSDFYLRLSRIISKAFISHAMKKFKLLRKNGKEYRKSWRVIQRLVLNCSALAALYRTRGMLHEKWGIEAKYIFWFIFCVLFHFCILSGRIDRDMKTLLCRGTVDWFPAVVRSDLRHTEPVIRYLPRAFLRGNATKMDSLPLISN
jgi:hypothetical protein